MNKVGRLAVTVLLLAGLLNVAALAFPGRAFACSCMPGGPERIGTFADDPRIVVFLGTIVSMSNLQDGSGHTRGQVQIHRVYKGQIPSALVPVIGGGGGDCTVSLAAGQRMITAASFEGGVITPGLCMPFGDPGTNEGQVLVQAAIEAYGPGAVPPGGPEPNPAPATSDPWLPIILGAAIAATVLLFLVVAVASKRGRTVG